MKFSEKIGWWLMGTGARFINTSDENVKEFKCRINHETAMISTIYTGDHLRDVLNPICDIEAEAILIALQRKNRDYDKLSHQWTESINYYQERWKY